MSCREDSRAQSIMERNELINEGERKGSLVQEHRVLELGA